MLNIANLTAPTSEIICAVRWLAKQDPNKCTSPIGSGVVYTPNGENCMVTANHVAALCNYNPLVRQHNSWLPAEWELVGYDTKRDIAVLHCLSANLLELTPRYGIESVIYATLGRALGFPAVRTANNFVFSEMDGLPLAIPVPVAAYFGFNANAEMDGMHYVGGYINAGFSGGAIVFPTPAGWTIAGIITEKASIVRPTYRYDQDIGDLSIDKNQVLQEHSGLTKYTNISIAEEIISRSNLAHKY